MIVHVIKPCGYCLGVVGAIKLAETVKKNYPERNIFIFGLLVHNNDVTNYLSSIGIKTIETNGQDKIKILNSFQSDDIVIFTAHGHLSKYEDILTSRGITFFDATCPIVKKNQEIIKEYTKNNQVIFIGKKNHPETEASLINDQVILYDINDGIDYRNVSSLNPLITNQTTLSFLELDKIHQDILNHFPRAKKLDEICSATRIRQTNICAIKDNTDLVIIVGSNKSSNTDKLFSLAKSVYPNKMVIKVENLIDLKKYDLSTFKEASIASGTSTPIKSIEAIKEYLEEN